MPAKKPKARKLTHAQSLKIERFHDQRKIRELEKKNSEVKFSQLQQKKKMLEQEVLLTGYSLDAAKKDMEQKANVYRAFTKDFDNFSKELRESLDLPDGSSFDYDTDTLEITLED